MNRLIKKDKYGYMPIDFMEVCDKLYALEDIEEELGIDLVSLLRINETLNKNKFYYYKTQYDDLGIVKIPINSYVLISLDNKEFILMHHEPYDSLSFKGYAKKWALTREELEDDRFRSI